MDDCNADNDNTHNDYADFDNTNNDNVDNDNANVDNINNNNAVNDNIDNAMQIMIMLMTITLIMTMLVMIIIWWNDDSVMSRNACSLHRYARNQTTKNLLLVQAPSPSWE